MSYSVEKQHLLELWEMSSTDDEKYFDDQGSDNEMDLIEEQECGGDLKQDVFDSEGKSKVSKIIPTTNVRMGEEKDEDRLRVLRVLARDLKILIQIMLDRGARHTDILEVQALIRLLYYEARLKGNRVTPDELWKSNESCTKSFI